MRRFAIGLIGLTIVLSISAAALPQTVLAPLASVLVVKETPRASNAIVVLLGGDTPDRVEKALELLESGHAPIIAFGSGYVGDPSSKTEPSLVWITAGERYRIALESAGLRPDQLLIIDSSEAYDTASELAAIANFAREARWQQVMLVTSATHSRRVQLIWERLAGDIPAVIAPADDPQLATWWDHPRAIRSIGYEYGALMKEFMRRIF